jgi:hypothetical protein
LGIVEAASQAVPLSPSELFVHLLVLGIDLPLLILQRSMFSRRSRCWSCTSVRIEDHAKERALLIHKPHIVAKPFLAAEGYLFKYQAIGL